MYLNLPRKRRGTVSEEIGFSVPSVTEENLKLLSLEGSIISERRICELSELASSLALFVRELSFEGGLGAAEILSLLSSELCFEVGDHHTDALLENKERLNFLLNLASAADKAVFSELFVKRLTECGVTLNEQSFFPQRERDGVITYVRNPYSDEAFDVFSQEFSDPRVKYSQSFKDAAKAVFDSEVSFALLPLEEKGGARLPTVTELIYKYDLKINSVTPVFGPDGASQLKYALVSRELSASEFSDGDDRYFEMRLDAGKGGDLLDFMLAVGMYGIDVYRINTVSVSSDGDEGEYFSVVVRRESCDFTVLLVYLTLFCKDFLAVGMYKNLE